MNLKKEHIKQIKGILQIKQVKENFKQRTKKNKEGILQKEQETKYKQGYTYSS